MKANSSLRKEARAALCERWGLCAFATLIYILWMGVATLSVLWRNIPLIIVCLYALPLNFWCYRLYYLQANRKEAVSWTEALTPIFSLKGLRIWGSLMLTLLELLLWTLLFIVPGVMKLCAYAAAPYILMDDKSCSFQTARNKSQKMMQGYKLKWFLFNLNYLGWFFLAFLTLGIGLLWLIPYYCMANAAFYDDVKKDFETAHFKAE